MKKAYYDLHIHTNRSQCADRDMAPQDIVNMAVLKELDVIAITDHNSSAACRECMIYAKDMPLLVIPGMELMTAEDIHVLCLFDNIDGAENFDRLIKQDFKGILEEFSTMKIDDVSRFAASFGGIAIPAHITRQANSILGILGEIYEELNFTTIEVTNAIIKLDEKYLKRYNLINNSDAHSLGCINERENFFHVSDISAESILKRLNKVQKEK